MFLFHMLFFPGKSLTFPGDNLLPPEKKNRKKHLSPLTHACFSEVQAFESLVAGNGTGEFCIIGAPVALAEFAQHLRYQSRAHWSGSEPMRWAGETDAGEDFVKGGDWGC